MVGYSESGPRVFDPPWSGSVGRSSAFASENWTTKPLAVIGGGTRVRGAQFPNDSNDRSSADYRMGLAVVCKGQNLTGDAFVAAYDYVLDNKWEAARDRLTQLEQVWDGWTDSKPAGDWSR